MKIDAMSVDAFDTKKKTNLGYGLHWVNADTALSLNGISPLLALTSDHAVGASKIAAFDLDSTIITSASGDLYAADSDDWMFWHDVVPERLKALHKEGFAIAFFTNQSEMEWGSLTPQIFMDKMEAVLKELDLPIQVFASTAKNHYRKPSANMWKFFVGNCNKNVQVEKSLSFFVGDAAGRGQNWSEGKPKDFACSDRMFAHNIGISFHTPEEFFLGAPPVPFEWNSFDPKEYLKSNPPVDENADKTSYNTRNQEVVVMVGMPASGKSTFCRRYLKPCGYIKLTGEMNGPEAVREALRSGQSVVVDSANPSISVRSNYVRFAKEMGIHCRCFHLKTPDVLVYHLNLFRENQTNGKVRRIPLDEFNAFREKFEEPTQGEGFSDVVEVDFKPCFDCKEDEELFLHWSR